MRPRSTMVTLNDVIYGLYHDIMYCHLELSFIFRCTCSEVFVMNLNLVCNNN